jgi:hypothetical protein
MLPLTWEYGHGRIRWDRAVSDLVVVRFGGQARRRRPCRCARRSPACKDRLAAFQSALSADTGDRVRVTDRLLPWFVVGSGMQQGRLLVGR